MHWLAPLEEALLARGEPLASKVSLLLLRYALHVLASGPRPLKVGAIARLLHADRKAVRAARRRLLAAGFLEPAGYDGALPLFRLPARPPARVVAASRAPRASRSSSPAPTDAP